MKSDQPALSYPRRLWVAWLFVALAVSGLAMLPAVALVSVALFALRAPMAIVGFVMAAQLCLWMYNSPINALLVNSVDPGLRARAFGLSILCIHLFGDVASPPLIGMVSDATGNLEAALIMVPVAVLLGGLIWIYAWRTLPVTTPPASV